MAETKTMKRHAGLVDRMAGTLGLDLEEQVYAGQLDPETLCDAVLTCTGCSDPDGCEAWLSAQAGTAETPPIMCRNGEMFAALKDGRRV